MGKPIDLNGLFALNQPFAEAFARGEKWALDHVAHCESINRGEPDGFRRKFDGHPRKWCGVSCPNEEGCITCTMEEDPNINWKKIRREAEYDPEVLAQRGVITLRGEINFDLALEFENRLQAAIAAGNQEIELRIESHGGMNRARDWITGLIEKAPARMTGYVQRYAYSAAAMILQACHVREVSPSATILVHFSRRRYVTRRHLENADFIRNSLAIDDAKVVEVLCNRTGQTPVFITQLCERDQRLSAEQALEIGLIDTIRT